MPHKTADKDDLTCAQCGYVQERTALPGQELQPSPGWICELCAATNNLNRLNVENERDTISEERREEITTQRAENKARIKQLQAERDEQEAAATPNDQPEE